MGKPRILVHGNRDRPAIAQLDAQRLPGHFYTDGVRYFRLNCGNTHSTPLRIPFDGLRQYRQYANFRWTKPAACLQPNGGEPELRNIVISHHMHMTGFLTIAGIEENRYGPCLSIVGICRPVMDLCRPPYRFRQVHSSRLTTPAKWCPNTPESSLINRRRTAEAVNLTGSNGIGYLHGSRRSHPILSY